MKPFTVREMLYTYFQTKSQKNDLEGGSRSLAMVYIQ